MCKSCVGYNTLEAFTLQGSTQKNTLSEMNLYFSVSIGVTFTPVSLNLGETIQFIQGKAIKEACVSKTRSVQQ